MNSKNFSEAMNKLEDKYITKLAHAGILKKVF